MDHHFGIGSGAETVAAPLELLAESAIVVNLPVEHDADRVVFVENRLTAAGEVDDRESPMAERHLVIEVNSGIIRPPMRLRLIHGVNDPAGLRVGVMVDDSGNPAHLQNSPG